MQQRTFTYPLSRFFPLLGLAWAVQPAFAIPTSVPKLRDHEIRAGFMANHYLTPTAETGSDSGTGNLALAVGVRGVGRRSDFHFAVEGETLYGLKNIRYHYIDIGELYTGFERTDSPRRAYVYLGRKRFEWSHLDSYWSMGLFQPRFRWDYLNERENGLVGLFGGYRGRAVQFTAYLSPLSVPEQGAPFEFNGGDCHTSSPWFSCPSSAILIFNQPTPVRFTLDLPPVKSLVLHGGGGATMRLGREEGPFTRLSYAYKPINQLLLSFEGRLNVAAGEVPSVIRPRVLYHHLYALDLGYAGGRHSLTASAIAERPEADATPASWNVQEASKANLFGLTARSQPLRASQYTRLEASYLTRDGGVSPDRGPFVSPGTNYFEPRYAFRNAFSLALFTPIRDAWARRLLVSSRFIVDTANEGNLLVSDVYFSPWASVILNAGFDLLGSNSPSPVDFLSRYQRNDRLRGGVAYVF